MEIDSLVHKYDLPEKKAELDSLKQWVFSKDKYLETIVSGCH